MIMGLLCLLGPQREKCLKDASEVKEIRAQKTVLVRDQIG